MTKTETKTIKEKMEDGHYQCRVNDVKNGDLLSTYQTTADGKKDGEEVEYFPHSDEVRKKTNWKNGQKDGSEVIYAKRPRYNGETVISAENEYKKGVCVNNREYFYGIDPSDLKEYSAQYILKHRPKGNSSADKIMDVVIENGKFRHITEMEKYYGHYKVVYDMEFKDGKPYEGKNSSGYYKEGKFTGKKYIPQEESPCDEFIPFRSGCPGIRCWQTIENDKVISNDAYYHISDGHDGGYFDIHIPQNGRAYKREHELGLILEFQMKDGKREGEYHAGGVHAYYKDGKLDGEYIDAQHGIKAYYTDGKLEGEYIEFFDEIDGTKKVEGFYKEGKKSGFWKYYSKDGAVVIKQEYYQAGKNCTKKYEAMKKVAAERIAEEDKLSEGQEKRIINKKMNKAEKMIAIAKARLKRSK